MVTYYVTKMLTTCSPIVKVIFYFIQWISAKKNWIWTKRDLLWSFKSLKILFCWGRPVSLITRSTCSELWRRFRNVWLQTWLIYSPYKMLLAGTCTDYRGKTSEMNQAWSHVFLNLRHNSEHVDAVISGTGRPQENRIFRFLNIHNKIAFYPNRKMFSQMFIVWNIGSDGKIKILMIWAL